MYLDQLESVLGIVLFDYFLLCNEERVVPDKSCGKILECQSTGFLYVVAKCVYQYSVPNGSDPTLPLWLVAFGYFKFGGIHAVSTSKRPGTCFLIFHSCIGLPVLSLSLSLSLSLHISCYTFNFSKKSNVGRRCDGIGRAWWRKPDIKQCS